MSYQQRDKRTGQVYFLPLRVEVECLEPSQFMSEEEYLSMDSPFLFDLCGMRTRFEDRLKDLTGKQYFTPEEMKKCLPVNDNN